MLMTFKEIISLHMRTWEVTMVANMRIEPWIKSNERFQGESDTNIFLDWEKKVENLFKVCNYSESAKAKLAIVEFSCSALHWWDKITTHRSISGAPMVDSSTEF